MTAAPVGAAEASRRSWRSQIGVYVRLCKPRVIELLLVTTVPAMVLAQGGMPPWRLMVDVLIGGTLAAAGANAANCWLERDRDQLMRRTHHRPLPTGEVSPTAALVFAIVVEIFAGAYLWNRANALSAALAVGAALFYVFVYTIWLKPRTTQNIVIGGAAGAVPALVGWAAVTGTLGAAAWVLFVVVFYWTPPHFWALSLRYRDDYAAAGIPMLPVVAGTRAATNQILLYSVVVLGVSLLLGAFTPVGPIYLATAIALGGLFVWKAVQLRRDPDPKRAIKFFMYSNTYLALLFVSVAVDTLVRAA